MDVRIATLSKLYEKLELIDWTLYTKLVADAYDAAPKYQSEEVWRWKLAIEHVEKLFERMVIKHSKQTTKSKYKIEYTSDDPYANEFEMFDDIIKNNRLKVYTGFNEHPVFTPEQNLKFRAVHDIYSHHHVKTGFGMKGEIRAYNAHLKLAPPESFPAMFTEIIGQAAYYVDRGKFTIQKIAILPGFDYVRLGRVEDYIIKNKELIPDDKIV